MSSLIAVIDRSDRSEGYGGLFTEQHAVRKVCGMREASMPNIQNGYVSDPTHISDVSDTDVSSILRSSTVATIHSNESCSLPRSRSRITRCAADAEFSLHPLFFFSVFPRTPGRSRGHFFTITLRDPVRQDALFSTSDRPSMLLLAGRRCQAEVLYSEIHFRFVNVDQSVKRVCAANPHRSSGPDWILELPYDPPASKKVLVRKTRSRQRIMDAPFRTP